MNTITRLAPATLDDAARMVCETAAAGLGILPVGGATKISPAAQPGGVGRGGRTRIELHTAGLNRVLDLSPGDLTVTVEGGITLASLETQLAEHGLRLPLDPPLCGGRATIGGVLAINDCGPLRHSLGAARDCVIGMTIIMADGAAVKAGGQVVKNVAGYDLHRLMVGSYGSLGVIGAVSFKLLPRPELRRLVLLSASSTAQADAWTRQLLNGPTRPALLDWVWPVPPGWTTAPVPEDALLLAVGFEGMREDVDGQVASVAAAFSPAQPLDAETSAARYDALRGRLITAAGHRFRASIPTSRIATALLLLPADARAHVHAGAGVIHGSLGAPTDRAAVAKTGAAVKIRTPEVGSDAGASPPPTGAMQLGAATDDPAAIAEALEDFGDYVRACRGWMKLQQGDGRPDSIRSIAPVADGLETRLKQRLDPDGVFPPAPFVS